MCRQVTECGRENLWYVPQCVECDAANGATELASRVSAILQVCHTRVDITAVVLSILRSMMNNAFKKIFTFW